MTNIISVFIEGGLGNQLFQIFACIATALEQKIPFRLPLSKHDLTSQKGAPRPTYWNNLLSRLKPFLTDDVYEWTHIYKQPSFSYHAVPPLHYTNIRMHGYFQSYRFFQKYEEQICRMLQIEQKRNEVREKFASMFAFSNINHMNHHTDSKLPSKKTCVTLSLHFRLGDYKHLDGFHQVLPYDYYASALTHAIKRINVQVAPSNPINHTLLLKIIYFGEIEDHDENQDKIRRLKCDTDILNAKHENSATLEFVQCSYDIPDWEQMLIMSCCNHHIIANSSFSWWGATLNPDKEKNVYYPSLWFGPRIPHNTSDMFPPEWYRILI